tara:strand:- start:819 stop:1142 length:324 start_codon:yes stop_codon:yes gene_type:complete
MKLKFDMGSILLGAGLAYYFHHQLKDVLGKFIQPKGEAAGSLSTAEVAALEAQAEAEVAAEDAAIAEAAAAEADMAGLHHYGAIHMNPSYGAIHLNPGHLRRNMYRM